jgi:cysteine-S-conjugate beta-lyase
MAFDFDTPINREGSDSLKWDRVRADRRGILPLWVADMDFAVAPAISEAIRKRAEHPVFGYAVRGPGYFAAVARWQERNGWSVERDWIVPVPGIVPALSLAIRAFTEKGDGVIVQPPIYPPFLKAVASNGRRLVENPLVLREGRYGIDFEGLETAARQGAKLLLLCSPHNPVGRVWSREELLGVAEICAANGITVVSDEIHSDLVMPGFRHTVFATLSPRAASISVVLNSPSKTFNIAGLQAANAIIPDNGRRDAFVGVLGSAGLGLGNSFGIAALEAAYMHGAPWLEEAILYIAGNYRYLEERCAERIKRVAPLRLEGTHLAWLDCRGLGLDPAGLDSFMLDEAKLWLERGTSFGTGGEGFQRLNLACPRSTLEEALARLEAAVLRCMT